MSVIIPTEAQEGEQLVAYLRMRGLPFTHIANETGSSNEARRRAVRMKRQGVSRGFPDYIVVVKNKTIAIELKRLKGSKVSDEQINWLTALNLGGVEARICKGAIEATHFVEEVFARQRTALRHEANRFTRLA